MKSRILYIYSLSRLSSQHFINDENICLSLIVIIQCPKLKGLKTFGAGQVQRAESTGQRLYYQESILNIRLSLIILIYSFHSFQQSWRPPGYCDLPLACSPSLVQPFPHLDPLSHHHFKASLEEEITQAEMALKRWQFVMHSTTLWPRRWSRTKRSSY